MTSPSVTDGVRFVRPWHRAGLGVAALLLAAAVATATFQAGHGGGRSPGSTPLPTVDAAQPQPQDTLGAVDAPADELIVGDTIAVAGWALDPAGVRAIEIRVDGRAYPARFGLPRPDVAALKPGYPDGVANGFAFEGHIPGLTPQRHDLAVVAIAKDGRETVLARKGLVPAAALRMWSDLLDARPALAAAPFSFLMMTSGLAVGGGDGIATQYRGYLSRTQRVGMAIPILYMRATRGAADDWVFDPEFDLTRKCGSRSVVDDNLGSVIRYAVRHALPVQFILNGGIWGDASCNTPEWDLNDHLEDDAANVQWSQDNQTFPDDYLKGQTGSTDSPELARTLTYNVYATKVRSYKRRNLQAAAAVVASFAREHPELFVGVVLDSDTYMNPFFQQKEVFDYNPGMIRQFRDWLRGAGPYAGPTNTGVPDLSAYRRRQPLPLAEVNRIARQRWKSWNEVDPPRHFPGSPTQPRSATGRDSRFRRPVVADMGRLPQARHRPPLRRALVVGARRGHPAQQHLLGAGLHGPGPGLGPFRHPPRQPWAELRFRRRFDRGRDPARWPPWGRPLRRGGDQSGAHGRSATASLPPFPGWIRAGRWSSSTRPTSSAQRSCPRTPRLIGPFATSSTIGGSEISVMAWNGFNGLFAGAPDYVPYTSWRNTPAEDAMRDFLVSHADLPSGAHGCGPSGRHDMPPPTVGPRGAERSSPGAAT